jgi:uncharacterized protein YycO
MPRLIFTRAANPAADILIRAFEGGSAGHVGIAMDEGGVIHATLRDGVHAQSMAEFLRDRIVVQEIPVFLPNQPAADAWLRAQLGKPYDWTGILGFLFWRDWQDDAAWWCSEAGAGWFLAGGASFASRHSRIGVRLFQEIAYARAAGRMGALA